MMERDRWEQIEQLYHAALEHGPDARDAFLSEACAGDEDLRCEVAGLLACDVPNDSFIQSPAIGVAARAMAAEPLIEASDKLMRSLITESQIGPYQLLEPLGRGGMGEVHLALDTRLGRKVTLKLLPAEFTTDDGRVRRFAQEARAASALNHPNIITIHEIGETATESGSLRYIVTEYVEGKTLRQRIARAPQQRIEPPEVIDIALQIAAALAAAHEAGITHRDIKPENVMARRDGIVKVLDFGLAKLTEPEAPAIDSQASTLQRVTNTESGVVMGTPRYMSPEQARGEKLDAQTDIFSLGVTLYEMIAGCTPFAGTTPGEVIAAILRDAPPPLAECAPYAPPELERIVQRALRKDRTERYQTAKDLLGDLSQLKERLLVEKLVVPPSASRNRTLPPKGGTTNGTTNKRRRAALTALTAIAISVAALVAWLYFNRAPVLTSKDTVLLADFDNKTGDAIFDGTLRQWLATQLEQSQMLRVFPEARVRQTLRQMERPVEERVTVEIAREVCERQHLKAFIAGSIAPLGSRYVLTLEAVHGQNGDVLTRTQAEAANKDQVLQALTQAATRLCAQLDSSLSSIQLSERPLQQFTTADLRAVKALSECNYLASQGRFVEALPFARRAAELDPRIAVGYNFFGVISMAAGQPEAAAEYHRKAFQLIEERAARQPDQVSEVAKMTTLHWYHKISTGNLAKAQEYGLLYRQLAPRHAPAHNDLGHAYNLGGQFEQAIPLHQEAIRLNPNFAAPYRYLAEAFIRLNRFAEARDTLRNALGLKLEFTEYHTQLYQLAFIDGDAVGMQQQFDWAKGKPEEYVAFDWQTGAAAFNGQWRRAQELSRQAINLAALGDNLELAARYGAEQALRAAVLGDCQASKASATQGLTFGRGRIPLARAALAFALCGETKQARTLEDELTKRFLEDTASQSIWLPAIRAALELQRGNAGQVIEQLQAIARYEAAAEFWPQYLRGRAYLKLGRGAQAAAEFQKILDRRGYAPFSPLYPLAHLGLARAATLAGDTTKSRKAWENFFAVWKDAESNLPILRDVKREYELAAKR